MDLRQYSGRSLLELLAVLAMAALLAATGLPSLRDFALTAQTEADMRAIAALVQTSRHAAIELNRPVILCPGTSTGCAGRDDWRLGVLAFADANDNRAFDPDEFRVAAAPGFTSSIRYRAFRNRSYLRFRPNGLTDWQNGHFLICPTSTNARLARQVTMNYAGRLYFSHDRDGDGVHEDPRGQPLTC